MSRFKMYMYVYCTSVINGCPAYIYIMGMGAHILCSVYLPLNGGQGLSVLTCMIIFVSDIIWYDYYL